MRLITSKLLSTPNRDLPQHSIIRRQAPKDQDHDNGPIESRFHFKHFESFHNQVKSQPGFLSSNIKADRVSSILNINDASEVIIQLLLCSMIMRVFSFPV